MRRTLWLGLLALCAGSLYASQIVVDGTVGTCLPIDGSQGCGISFQIFGSPAFSKPAGMIIDSVEVDVRVRNNSSTDPVDYSLGIEQAPVTPLFYAFSGTLAPGQISTLVGGPFLDGASGVVPPQHLSTSSLDFLLHDWNTPQNGVVPGVFFNDSPSGGPTIDVLSATMTLTYEIAPVPEPCSMALLGAGIGLGALLRRRIARSVS